VEKVWVRTLGEPPFGVVVDGLAVGPGELIQVTPRTARQLLGAGRAVLAEPPEPMGDQTIVAQQRKRVR